MKCIGTNKDGSPCGYEGKFNGYCARHRRETGRDFVAGGKYAVAEDYVEDYERFINERDPFDLSREAAFLRTLILRVHDSIENRKLDIAAEFLDDCRDSIALTFMKKAKMDKARAERYAHVIVADAVSHSFEKVIGVVDDISPSKAKDLASLVKSLTDTLQKWKKLEEGRKYTFDINEDLMRQFVLRVVYPVIPANLRLLIAQRAEEFRLGTVQGVRIRQPDVVDAEIVEESEALVHVDG